MNTNRHINNNHSSDGGASASSENGADRSDRAENAGNPGQNPIPGMELLAKLSKEIGDFDQEIREQLAARLRNQAANEASNQPVRGAASCHGEAGSNEGEEGAFVPYQVKPGDEMPNLLGELAEPGSVFRMNTLISPSFPMGPVGPYMSKAGAMSPQRPARLSIALLGSGDQSLVLPLVQRENGGAATATINAPPKRQSRVKWIQAVKTWEGSIPGMPPDALMVTGIDQPRCGKGTGPWMLDHLELPGAVAADLQHAILSLKPSHQAFAMAAISIPTIERGLIDMMPSVHAGVVAHPLVVGLVALEQVQGSGLNQDQVSLVRLACLIADLGKVPTCSRTAGDSTAANENDWVSTKPVAQSAERVAHPMTQLKLRRMLGRFIQAMHQAQDSRLSNLAPERSAGYESAGQASNQEGIWLQQLLSDSVLLEYRLDSRRGPLSENPISPDFCAMARAFSDAIQLARREANARLSHGKVELVLVPVPGQECSGSISTGVTSTQSACAANDEVAQDAHVGGDREASVDKRPEFDQEGPAALPGEKELASEHEASGNADTVCDDQPQLFGYVPAQLNRDAVRIPDHERRAYQDRSIPWPCPSLSWAAGMLDGDGCVAIVRQTYPDRNANYRLVVQVTQNCLQTLEHFRSCVGVTAPIHEVKRRIGHNRQVYTLNYAGPKALLVLQRLRAYLVRKRPEAEVALSFIEKGQVGRRFGPRGVPPQLEAIRISHYNKLRALK
ncbi:hypothetical protein [Hydrogenophaga sp. R2]|uniref:hypothetical protein n=1 Tax=Hydrogenophaga sp. R2 TaxID=3132827 RepID=UPI003CEDE3D2